MGILEAKLNRMISATQLRLERAIGRLTIVLIALTVVTAGFGGWQLFGAGAHSDHPQVIIEGVSCKVATTLAGNPD